MRKKPLPPYAPVLAGHAFQQTAIIAMVPLISALLGLSETAVGGAVAAGMLAAAPLFPIIMALAGRLIAVGAVTLVVAANLGLIALLILGPLYAGSVALIPILAGLRFTQAVAAGALTLLAQHESARSPTPGRGLGRVQTFGGLGRVLAAMSVGPLAALSPILPILPALAGALLGGVRLRPMTFPNPPRRLRPPPIGTYGTSAALQLTTGAAHVGLAPLLTARFAEDPTDGVLLAGICLGCANLGILFTGQILAPRAVPRHGPVAALTLLLIGLSLATTDTLWIFLSVSLLLGACLAFLQVLNLSDILTRPTLSERQVLGWNGTVQTGSLAVGIGLGASLLPLSPAAPFVLVAICGGLLSLRFLLQPRIKHAQ